MSRFAWSFRLGRLASGLRVSPRAALLVPLVALCLAATAHADPAVQRSYIDPFPNGDRYRIAVLGDSLGEGLWEGLYRAFEDDPTLDIIQLSKKSTGLSRTDNYDWNKQLDQILKDGSYQVAVVMFGATDSQAMKGPDGKWLKVGSEGWREAYGARVEAFIKKLKAANIAVYWVGLPVMRSPTQTADAEQLNDLYREKAFINGAKYIDTWDGFVDEQGRFSALGPDMSGQTKRLRAGDGVHFTMRGYLKLAHFVEQELRKDITQAKTQRNVPLAGNEDEQAKVTTRFASVESAEEAEAEEAAAAANGEGEDDALRREQVGDVSVVRPTLDRAALQSANATPRQANATTTEPDAITSALPGGYTAIATISAVADLSAASSRPQLPLAQRPYYRVLIQGEQLEPKSGRADDFAWPPS